MLHSGGALKISDLLPGEVSRHAIGKTRFRSGQLEKSVVTDHLEGQKPFFLHSDMEL